MSVIQSQQDELRYLKRKNLEQESRIIGNAMRDQIRAYGVDCIYYKLNEKGYTNFNNVVDSNTILRRAYGYDQNPDYTMSAHMITYADVQSDMFQLNKYGYVPDAEIDFNFDKIDFACALATRYGQFKEYQIKKTPIFASVPDPDKISGEFELDSHLNSLQYHCQMLTGWFKAAISSYQYLDGGAANESNCHTIETTISCDPYEHTDFSVSFPTNNDLYRSLQYKIQNDEFLETKIWLTYVINKIKVADGSFKNVLSGYVHGSVLFFDIDMLGKYVEKIRPAIGDIIAIDFPSDKNREMYEVTDCFDKQLTQDGISPLLHNYIWKCKAKRYVNAHEELAPANEADERVDEHQKYDTLVDSIVTDQVEMYDTIGDDVREDAVYGGMDTVIDQYDNQVPRPTHDRYDFIDDGTAIDLMTFSHGSKLITNGYDLIFMDNGSGNEDGKPQFYKISTQQCEVAHSHCMLEQDLRWLKATDSQIVFVNIEGDATIVAFDGIATKGELEICLNSLNEKTLDTCQPINTEGQSFYKFKGTRTYLWSDGKHLFAKLASSGVLNVII